MTFLCSFDEFELILLIGFSESAWKNNVSHNTDTGFPLYHVDVAQAPSLARSIVIALVLRGGSQYERHVLSYLFRAVNQISARAKLKG